MSEKVLALFNLTRIVFIKNSIMQISVDERHQIDWALENQFSFSALIHTNKKMEIFVEPAYVAKI